MNDEMKTRLTYSEMLEHLAGKAGCSVDEWLAVGITLVACDCDWGRCRGWRFATDSDSIRYFEFMDGRRTK